MYKLTFTGRFAKMKNAGGYYVIVIEDRNSGKVVGSATLVVEQKFIHNCALVSFILNSQIDHSAFKIQAFPTGGSNLKIQK